MNVDWRARAFIAGMLPAVLFAALLAWGPVWRAYSLLPPQSLRSDRLRITHDIAGVWRDAVPDVLILGGSQVREAMPDASLLSGDLTTACRRPIRVFVAASSSQLLETSWAIADRFETRAPALVMIGPNLLRDVSDRAFVERLGRSRFLIPEAASMPRAAAWRPQTAVESLQGHLGIVFADLVTVAGLRENSSRASPDAFDSNQHNYQLPVLDRHRKLIDARYAELIAYRLSDRALGTNLDAYSAFAGQIRARKGRAVFLLTPTSPESRDVYDRVDRRFGGAAVTLARAGDVLDLRAAVPLEAGDFYDTVHLVRSGRQKLWPALRAALAQRLPGCTSPVPP